MPYCVFITSQAIKIFFFFFSSRRRHTRFSRDWSSDVCSSDLAPVAIGEEAEMANPDEAIGDDVEQEAPDELVDRELHDLHSVAVSRVPPAEADAAISEGEEAVVGERDAVGVAAEIGEHVVGPGEGRLAVDDPGRPAEFGEPGGEGRRLGEGRQGAREMQLTPLEGSPQTGQIAAPEELGHRPDGEEEAGAGGQPARAAWRQRATGHDTVDVNMLREVLAPCVEDRGHAHGTPEVPRIAPEPLQRRGSAVKEQAIEEPRVTLRQRIEGVGQREHNVEVGDGQDLAAAGGEPALGGYALTLRAVAVPTGVVGDTLAAARRADSAMAAQHGRAATGDGVQGAVLGG